MRYLWDTPNVIDPHEMVCNFLTNGIIQFFDFFCIRRRTFFGLQISIEYEQTGCNLEKKLNGTSVKTTQKYFAPRNLKRFFLQLCREQISIKSAEIVIIRLFSRICPLHKFPLSVLILKFFVLRFVIITRPSLES